MYNQLLADFPAGKSCNRLFTILEGDYRSKYRN